MLTKDKKEKIIKEIKQKAKDSKAIVFANYSGLGVKDISDLRKELREQGVEFKVARKTLVNLALKEANINDVDARALDGQLGVAFGLGDEVAPAKIINKFSKTNENLKILGGILENKFIDADSILALAKLPSREELLAKVVGSISAPMSGLLNVFGGNMRALVYALNAVKEKKA